MFLTSVAIGRAYATMEGRLNPADNLCPPPGFDSVIGEVREEGGAAYCSAFLAGRGGLGEWESGRLVRDLRWAGLMDAWVCLSARLVGEASGLCGVGGVSGRSGERFVVPLLAYMLVLI